MTTYSWPRRFLPKWRLQFSKLLRWPQALNSQTNYFGRRKFCQILATSWELTQTTAWSSSFWLTKWPTCVWSRRQPLWSITCTRLAETRSSRTKDLRCCRTRKLTCEINLMKKSTMLLQLWIFSCFWSAKASSKLITPSHMGRSSSGMTPKFSAL